MADNPLEQVLLEMGLDLSPIQNAGKVVLATMADLNKITDQYQAKSAAAGAAQLSSVQQAAQAAIRSALSAVAEENKKQAVLSTQTNELKKQAQEQALLAERSHAFSVAEQARVASTKLETAELEKQTAELQRQVAALRAKNAVGGSGGPGGINVQNLASTLATSALGGTLGSALIGGLTGGGIALAVTALTQKIGGLISKLEEVTVSASKLVQVSDVFERLARGAGIDATQMLENMRKSTEGLVDRLTLTRVAVAALSNNLKLQHGAVEQATGDIVRLAEAHGKDAQGSMERFVRMLETGRINARALGIGIQQAELQLKGLPPNMDAVSKKAAEMSYAFDVIHKRSLALGDLPQTLQQMEHRINVITKDMFESFGKGFNESLGAQTFIRFLSGNVEAMTQFEKKVEEWGKTFGQVLGAIGPALLIIKTAVVEITDILLKLISTAGSLFGAITADANGAENSIRKIGHAFIYVNIGIGVVAAGIKILLADIALIGPVMKDIIGIMSGAKQTGIAGLAKDLPELFKKLPDKLRENAKPIVEELKTQYGGLLKDFDDALDKAGESLKKKAPGIKHPDETSEQTWQQKMKLAQLRLQLAHKQAAEEIAQRKADLDELKRLDEEAYKEGEEDLEKHWNTQRTIAKQQRDARNGQILEDYNAQMDELKTAKPGMIAGEFQLKADAAKTDRDKRLIQSEASLQAELFKIDEDINKQRITGQQKAIQDETAIAEQRIRLLQTINEKEFQGGEKSPDAYFARQVELTERLALAQIGAAQRTFDAGNKGIKEQQELQFKKDKAREDAEKAFTLLQESEADKRFQYVQKQFEPQQKAIETRVAYQRTGTPEQQAQVPELIQRLQDNLVAQRSALEGALATATPYSDTWYRIYDTIEKVYQSQVKYNEELKKMADLMGPIGLGFAGLGKDLGEVFQSRFAQNLAQTIQSGAQNISKSTERGNILFGRGGVSKDPAMVKLEEQASKLFSNIDTSSTTLSSNFDTLSLAIQRVITTLNQLTGSATASENTKAGASGVDEDGLPADQQTQQGSYGTKPKAAVLGHSFDKTTKQVLAAADALAGFVATLTQAKTAITGVVGGGLSGAGLGNMILPGPLGAALGAGLGAALGGIIGSKNAAVKANIDQMNTTYKAVMNEFAQNTNNLQNTISQIQLLLQQARDIQSNSKKGSSEYQKAIDQYTQELVQLQTQQLHTITTMNEQLAVLSEPVGGQGFLNDLKGILEQYQQFEGAAQNAIDLANANKFLVVSLQQYEDNLSTQLLQDNTQAINDALRLNDLMYQRSQLLLQYNNQVQGVLSQGVLTRQMTRAQTAGQQIEQLSVAFTRQMEQTNEEIAATQFKVQAEGQIFNLATTRVGLETQLLQLQNSQTNLDMARIGALSALISQLQAGNFAQGALGALLAAIPTVSNPVIGGSQNLLQALLGIAAEATNSQMTKSFEDLVAAAYQDRATLGYGTFQAQNL